MVRLAAAALPSPPFPGPTIRLLTLSGDSSPADMLATALLTWARAGSCQVHLAPAAPSPFAATDRAPRDLALLSAHTSAVSAAVGVRGTPATMRHLLGEILGPSGLSCLFALRRTPGSLPGAVLPSRTMLATAALIPVSRGMRVLTTAGRALEKHIGRRGLGWGTSFWGREDAQGGGS